MLWAEFTMAEVGRRSIDYPTTFQAIGPLVTLGQEGSDSGRAMGAKERATGVKRGQQRSIRFVV